MLLEVLPRPRTENAICGSPTAGWGAGVVVYNSDVTISNTEIYQNTATGFWIGAGVSIQNATVTISDTAIYGNVAGYVRSLSDPSRTLPPWPRWKNLLGTDQMRAPSLFGRELDSASKVAP